MNVESNNKQVFFTPQQSGVVERPYRTIMECSRSMICAQEFDLESWAEVMNTTIYIKNQCLTKPSIQRPHKKYGLVQSSIYFIQDFFGYKIYAHIPDERKSKLESKSIPCVF
jgi:hypothetical protein